MDWENRGIVVPVIPFSDRLFGGRGAVNDHHPLDGFGMSPPGSWKNPGLPGKCPELEKTPARFLFYLESGESRAGVAGEFHVPESPGISSRTTIPVWIWEVKFLSGIQ